MNKINIVVVQGTNTIADYYSYHIPNVGDIISTIDYASLKVVVRYFSANNPERVVIGV